MVIGANFSSNDDKKKEEPNRIFYAEISKYCSNQIVYDYFNIVSDSVTRYWSKEFVYPSSEVDVKQIETEPQLLIWWSKFDFEYRFLAQIEQSFPHDSSKLFSDFHKKSCVDLSLNGFANKSENWELIISRTGVQI